MSCFAITRNATFTFKTTPPFPESFRFWNLEWIWEGEWQRQRQHGMLHSIVPIFSIPFCSPLSVLFFLEVEDEDPELRNFLSCGCYYVKRLLPLLHSQRTSTTGVVKRQMAKVTGTFFLSLSPSPNFLFLKKESVPVSFPF